MSVRPENLEVDGAAMLEGVAGLSAVLGATAADLIRMLAGWSVPVVALDNDDTIVLWNLGAAHLYRCSAAEVVGKKWTEAVGESEIVERPRAAGTLTHRYEALHRTGADDQRNVVVTRTELTGRDGVPSGTVALVLDMTESKLLERSLQRRLAELQVIREIAECLQSEMEVHRILRTILVGATAGQGLRFNRAFLLLVDLKRGRLTGRDAIGPADAEEARRIWEELDARDGSLKQLLKSYEPLVGASGGRVHATVESLTTPLSDDDAFLIRAMRGGRSTKVENGAESDTGRAVEESLLTKLGVRSFAAVPLTAHGKPVGLMIADNAITARPIVDDDIMVLELLGIQAALAIDRARVTEALATQVSNLERVTAELRAHEERLVRAERLSAVGEVAARVVHEIRNPLAAIGGFARSLLESDGTLWGKREALEIIVDEVRRLETIVREVLDFSRPSPPKIGIVRVDRLAQEVVDLLRWEMDDARVEARIEADPVPPPAAADRDQVFQALVNVVRNGVHAMPQGGVLVLRVRASGHAVEIVVEDGGVGMPPDVKARVFEPFFTTKASGSGLGLTIASQIVREHGGEIQIDSAEGRGTAVTLRFPVAGSEEGIDEEDPGR
jgi:signal transduction histidine kinase